MKKLMLLLSILSISVAYGEVPISVFRQSVDTTKSDFSRFKDQHDCNYAEYKYSNNRIVKQFECGDIVIESPTRVVAHEAYRLTIAHKKIGTYTDKADKQTYALFFLIGVDSCYDKEDDVEVPDCWK